MQAMSVEEGDAEGRLCQDDQQLLGLAQPARRGRSAALPFALVLGAFATFLGVLFCWLHFGGGGTGRCEQLGGCACWRKDKLVLGRSWAT